MALLEVLCLQVSEEVNVSLPDANLVSRARGVFDTLPQRCTTIFYPSAPADTRDGAGLSPRAVLGVHART